LQVSLTEVSFGLQILKRLEECIIALKGKKLIEMHPRVFRAISGSCYDLCWPLPLTFVTHIKISSPMDSI